MLKKTKRNVFATLSFLFALSMATAGGAMAQNVVKAEEADASMLTMTDGGYIRLGWEENENGEITTNGDTGIMFQATASTALAEALASDENATVGMMIVPQKVITAYNNQKETGEKDYFKYIVSKVPAATEEKIASVFAASQLSKEEPTNLKVSIADLEDVNYNQAYQAVAYYKTNNTYYYSAQSDVRTVAEMADIALRTDNLSEKATQAAASVIEKAIELKNDGLALTVKTLSTANLQDLFASYIQADDLTFTVKDTNVASVDSGVVTTLVTSGETTVNVTAYNGAVDFDVTVTAKAERDAAAKWQNSSSFYTTYGATVENKDTNAFTGLAELNNVTLAAGTLSEGTRITQMGTTNLSYLAFNRTDNNYSSFNANDSIQTYVTTVEFTGNNMPMVSYFVSDDSEETPMYNVVGQKGVLVTNGFGGFAGTADGNQRNSFKSKIKVFGYKQLISDLDNAGTTSGSETITDGSIFGNGSTSTPNAASYASLSAEANANQRYRLFVLLTAYLKTAATSTYALNVQIALYTINEDDTNGEQIYNYSANRGYIWEKDNFQGNIVLYGRPGETTKLDKVHFVNSVGGVANKVADFATAPAA